MVTSVDQGGDEAEPGEKAAVPGVVDVLIADHAAPRVVETLYGRRMVAIEGGTQALRRTVDARVQITRGGPTTISVPDPFGALILKAAAYRVDSRDRNRHLDDAVALLACIDDPFTERERFAGSDRKRLASLERALLDEAGTEHPSWLRLPAAEREQARAALRLLCLPD